MKRKIRIPILLVLLCFLTMPFKSCVDSEDYDFDKLSEKIDWQPNFVAPIGFGKFSLEYLLNQQKEGADQTIFFEPDGSIHIKYMEKDIFNYTASDVLNFPEQDPYSTTFDMLAYPIGPLPFLADATLPSIKKSFDIKVDRTGIILTELKLDAKITFIVSNPVDKEITLSVTLDEGSTDGINPHNKTFTILPNANSQTFEWDLSNLTFTFPTPSINNTLNISFGAKILKGSGNTIVSNGNDLVIGYQFGGIVFDLAKGDFGDKKIEVGSGDIDLGVDFWDDIDGKFSFAAPVIKLVMNNKVGVPFELTAEMTGSNSEGETQGLNLLAPLFLDNYPKTEEDVNKGVVGIMKIDNGNSDIVELMALPPSGNITYTGSLVINPNDYNPQVSGLNIISGTSSISADLEMDIPMDFKAGNLSISDTIDEIDIDDAEKMMKASIIITSENGLPLDVKIENIFFTDAAYTVLSTISNESIIKAAAVTASGDVDPTQKIEKVTNEIELTEAQIISLNDTENIIIKASMSTTNEGATSVKLKGADTLKFSISVSAQLDLSN